MRIAAFQFDVLRGDPDANLAAVEEGMRAAAADGVQLVSLPEMWPTSFVGDGDERGWLEATDRALERVRALSEELELVVCGSAYGRGPAGGLPTNRLHVFDRGELVLQYDKVHLFSPTAEPASFTAGDRPPATVLVRGVRLSGVVCYDLRFAPLLRAPFEDEAELLVVPAQWPDTRASHWRALVLGRAVEHQAFLLAVNRTGRDAVGRRGLELAFPGNSMVVDPHGEVLAEGRGAAGLVVADVDLEAVRRLRRRVPVRRDDRGRDLGR